MPSPVKIKFSTDIPFTKEMNLVQKHGFTIHSRKKGEYVIFEKKYFGPPKKMLPELPELAQDRLLKRINKIVSWYEKPQEFSGSIRLRLNSLAAGLDPTDRKFVQDWTDEHFPEKVSA